MVAAEPSSTVATAPPVAPVSSVAAKKPLSVWVGVAISVGLLLLVVALVVSLDDAESAKAVIGPLAFGTAVWAAIDARRIGLKNYKNSFAKGPIVAFFVWMIAFPLSCGWYLVVRSRIKAGVMSRLNCEAGIAESGSASAPAPLAASNGPSASRSAMKVLAWICGAVVLIALCSAALYIKSGSSIKEVWQTTDSQLAAANTTAGTPTPQIATDVPKPSEPAVEGDSAVIGVVKNGVLANYNTTTVGKALEGTFQNPKWTSFVSPKGVTVVQFDGTITALKLTEHGFVEFDGIYKKPASELVDGCIEKLGLSAERAKFNMDWLATTPSSTLLSTNPLDVQHYNIQKCVAAQVAIPVQFQFLLSADHTSFQIGYLDETPFMVNRRYDVEKVFAFIYQ